jgi:hypothetical protein
MEPILILWTRALAGSAATEQVRYRCNSIAGRRWYGLNGRVGLTSGPAIFGGLPH